jgi:hypothetical protein
MPSNIWLLGQAEVVLVGWDRGKQKTKTTKNGGTKMKEKATLIIAVMCLVCMTLAFVGASNAEDIIFETKILKVKHGVDKNGQNYARFIILEHRKLNGHRYTAEVAVMAFRNHYKAVKDLKPGSMLKAVCSRGEYKGKTTYAIVAVLPSAG